MEFSRNKKKILFDKGYSIDKYGIIRNKNNKIIKCHKDNRGYLVVSIRFGIKSSIKIYVHRFQAYIKYGNDIYKNGIEVRHLNGIKTDNSYNNISIGTHSENILDINPDIRIKSVLKASKSRKNAYNKDTIYKIKKDRELGMTYKEIMDKYNVSSKGTINYILKHDYKYFDI